MCKLTLESLRKMNEVREFDNGNKRNKGGKYINKEKEEMAIAYIKANPKCTTTEIVTNTTINRSSWQRMYKVLADRELVNIELVRRKTGDVMLFTVAE